MTTILYSERRLRIRLLSANCSGQRLRLFAAMSDSSPTWMMPIARVPTG